MSDDSKQKCLADIYREAILKARFLPERSAQHDHFNSIVRSILQVSSLAAIEYLSACGDDLSTSALPRSAAAMMQPTDGDLERVLNTCVPLLESAGLPLGPLWFAPGTHDPSMRDRVAKWCEYRNARPGHGVVSSDVREEALSWLPNFAESLLEALTPLMPRVNADGCTYLEVVHPTAVQKVDVPTVQVRAAAPVVRRIRQRHDHWQVEAQALDPDHSPDFAYGFTDAGLIRLVSEASGRYRQIVVNSDADSLWRPTVLLPQRQTDTFEGRATQIKEIVKWLDDPDSRACNLHGDGGIGKTTLVLEALNRLVDGHLSTEWKPDVICFFSAKLTRWGPDGLVWLKGVAPPLEEAVRALAAVYEEPSGREWHALSGRKLISRVETLLADLGVDRDSVLLVLDNTETLARSSEDEQRLAEAIEHITRRLARVLITSRRRERMEARPIEVPPLTLEESLRLVGRLAELYDARPILQAGTTGRRKLVTALGGHPIKIDACCRLVGRFGHKLDRAQQQVLSSEELGEFLYEDAWVRIERPQQLALVALAQLGDALSGDLIHFICGELKTDLSRVLDALEETKFASRYDYSTHFDIRLEPSALPFLRSAFGRLDDAAREAVGAATSRASQRRAELARAQQSFVSDRVSAAFRTDAAKAAWQAAARGQLEDAIFWYEEALKVDPSNSQLLERFAFFLAAKVRDTDRARLLADQACELDGTYSDAFFTAGHIAASLGDVAVADERLARALKLGFPEHRCDLQRARARMSELDADERSVRGRPIDLSRRLREVEKLLRSASLSSFLDERDRKHQFEVNQVRRKANRMARRFGVRL